MRLFSKIKCNIYSSLKKVKPETPYLLHVDLIYQKNNTLLLSGWYMNASSSIQQKAEITALIGSNKQRIDFIVYEREDVCQHFNVEASCAFGFVVIVECYRPNKLKLVINGDSFAFNEFSAVNASSVLELIAQAKESTKLATTMVLDFAGESFLQDKKPINMRLIDFIPVKVKVYLRKINWLKKLYYRYFNKVETLGSYSSVLELQGRVLEDLVVSSSTLKFSVVVPIYKPDIDLFKQMINSVLSQSYDCVELVLVDDASGDEQLSLYMSSIDDERVVVVTREVNGHISAASNSGLEVCNGDYVVLLDHDDLLHKHCLKAAAFAIESGDSVNILYSDEDKVDANGNVKDPHFKPDYNPELLLSHNYISHVGIYKRSLVESVGGFRIGFEGSQDYDLLLRCVGACNGKGIVHLPYVLYSWRAVPGSTAYQESEKDYTSDAGLKAVSEYVFKFGASCEMGLLTNTYKVNWSIPEPKPLVSIIIPTRNGLNLVKQCIDSVYSLTSYHNFEILLVDNQSDDNDCLIYFEELDKSGKVRLIRFDEPFNFSAMNNYAVRYTKGSLICLLNNDIEVISGDWLTEMVSQASRESVGCVGAKLYYPNDTIQHGGVVCGIGGVAGHAHKYFPKEHTGYFKRLKVVQNYSAVTGACLMLKKSIFEEVRGLNEQYLTIAFNDVDLCLKVQAAGYKNVWTPYAELYHHESISRGAEDSPEKVSRFNSEVEYMKITWGEELAYDPCYSKYLTNIHEDFSLK